MKQKLFLTVLLNILLAGSFHLNAQTDSVTLDKKRFNMLMIGTGSLYAVSMGGLYYLWYYDYPMERFHFFNDNKEWLQIDKIGHAKTAYSVSKYGYYALKWAGVSDKRSLIYAASTGMLFLTTIEIFDGFSKGWGFSPGDMVANISGTTAFVLQQALWGEERINFKFGYQHSDYAAIRPDVLGSNFQERLLKDYNGQTYWLSFNIHSLFFKNTETHFPKWLNVAVGMGADGMITGMAGVENNYNPPLPVFDRYRQYYLSLDVNLTKIPVKNKFLKTVFNVVNLVKIPAPAIEYNVGPKTVRGYLLFL